MTAHEAFSDERVARMVNAAVQGELDEVDRQIKAGADVNAIGKDGVSPLLFVLINRQLKGAEHLLKAGANPNYKASLRNGSAMALAAGGNWPEALELLLKHGGDPNMRGLDNNDSLLIIAVMQFREQNIRILLDHGADVNIPRGGKFSNADDTAANVAAGLGRFDFVHLFLERGLNYSLQRLAASVEISKVPPNSEQQRWKDKVIAMLKERGACFPAFDPKNPQVVPCLEKNK
jgi:ankyrin repeat protein